MKKFRLAHDLARESCAAFVWTAPEGWDVTFSEPRRSNDQNSKMHAMISDIAKQAKFMNQKMDADDWKRLLIDAFAKVMRDAGTPLHHDGRVVPSLDGQRVVQLGIQSSAFYKAEASEFIEFLFSWGAENNIVWTETVQRGFMEAA
jgi:hypothetical protein